MIVRDCTILLKSDSATLSETLVLYKGDQNIEYTFTLKDNAYKFSNGTDGNIVTQLEASYAQILWYKNAEIRITFPIQETNDGKVVLKITKELIDEDNEIGDYDFQIRLYDSNKEAILTLPPLLKVVHIKAPLFEKDPLADLASADVSTLVTAGPEETIYGTDGNYLKTTWVPGMIITSAKLNKIETALYDACRTKTAGDISLTDTSGNFTSDNVEGALSEINSQIKDKANLTELEVERKRIDSFVRLENGSTTGDAELMDIRIGADSNEYVTAGQAVREQIKQYVKYVGVNSENLFDYINATDGYYNSLDGTLNTTSGYKTTGLIPYKVGDVIRKSKDVSWFVQWIGFFDINGNILISDIGIDDYVDRSNSSYDEFCLSEKPQNGSLDNLAYITIAVSNFGETNDFANYMIVKNIDYPSNYVPYGFNYSNNFTNKILEEIEKNVVTPPIQIPSILDNKTLLFSGDSIMQALIENGDGTYGESYGWAELLKESNPLAIVKNYGQGGTTIAKRSDRTDSILERIDKMHTENPNADYIIFEGGVNDCYSNVPLGEITSDYNSLFDESTFCGALESLLKQAIVKWKGKKICYIVTFKVPTADYANFSEYMKKAKEICEKWSIPYIDLYTQSGMEYHIKEIATAYSYGGGGLHPNIEGYKLTIPKIAEFIKSL